MAVTGLSFRRACSPHWLSFWWAFILSFLCTVEKEFIYMYEHGCFYLILPRTLFPCSAARMDSSLQLGAFLTFTNVRTKLIWAQKPQQDKETVCYLLLLFKFSSRCTKILILKSSSSFSLLFSFYFSTLLDRCSSTPNWAGLTSLAMYDQLLWTLLTRDSFKSQNKFILPLVT